MRSNGAQDRRFQKELKARKAAEAEADRLRAEVRRAEEKARFAEAKAATAEEQKKEATHSAMAAMARGVRVEKWCDAFVLGEEGEIVEAPLRRAVQTLARSLDIGFAGGAAAASKAALAMERERHMPEAELSELMCGASVLYVREGGSLVPAVVTQVDRHVGEAASYVVRFEEGRERSVERRKLVPVQ